MKKNKNFCLLLRFLKENDIFHEFQIEIKRKNGYDRFINFVKKNSENDNFQRIFDLLLTWNNTKRGFYFWAVAHESFRKLYRFYDNIEIPYKEFLVK